MYDLGVQINDDGTWVCQHINQSGKPAPPMQMHMNQTVELNPGFPTSAPRRWVNCPECGTYWRVWPKLKIAKPGIEFNPSFYPPGSETLPQRYRRAPLLDIDRVIDLVRMHLPEISVSQFHGVWPADDEGVWLFRLPNVRDSIQLESWTGMCPFLMEHDEMKSPADGGGWKLDTVEDIARVVAIYLHEKAATNRDALLADKFAS